jgi:hypothetical protein
LNLEGFLATPKLPIFMVLLIIVIFVQYFYDFLIYEEAKIK